MSASCDWVRKRDEGSAERMQGAERSPKSSLLAKTASWSLLHVLITMFVVWGLTGDPAAALAIGLLEPFVQTFAYAAHERFWQARAVLAGSGRGLILKTFSYFVVHMGVAASLVWLLTGDLKAALTLGLIEPLVQTIAFNCHERVWARLSGRASRDTGTGGALIE